MSSNLSVPEQPQSWLHYSDDEEESAENFPSFVKIIQNSSTQELTVLYPPASPVSPALSPTVTPSSSQELDQTTSGHSR